MTRSSEGEERWQGALLAGPLDGFIYEGTASGVIGVVLDELDHLGFQGVEQRVYQVRVG